MQREVINTMLYISIHRAVYTLRPKKEQKPVALQVHVPKRNQRQIIRNMGEVGCKPGGELPGAGPLGMYGSRFISHTKTKKGGVRKRKQMCFLKVKAAEDAHGLAGANPGAGSLKAGLGAAFCQPGVGRGRARRGPPGSSGDGRQHRR